MDLAKQEAINFFAEFLEKSWYCEFGLKDTLTIFNFCHDQKYQFQNTIIISKLLSKPKMTTASLIKKIRIRTQFRKSHGIQKDCYILNLKKIWQTFKMTVISLICNFSEMNSFCLWVTAKKMTRYWWQKWVLIFCCQQFPSEKTYWHLITHHGHFPCHFSFKPFPNFLIIALFPFWSF